MEKKKDWKPETYLIIDSINLAIYAVIEIVLLVTIFKFIKVFVYMTSEDYTLKLVFLGLILVFSLFYMAFKIVPGMIEWLVSEIIKEHKKIGGKTKWKK